MVVGDQYGAFLRFKQFDDRADSVGVVHTISFFAVYRLGLSGKILELRLPFVWHKLGRFGGGMNPGFSRSQWRLYCSLNSAAQFELPHPGTPPFSRVGPVGPDKERQKGKD